MRPARGPGLPNQLGDIMPNHGEAEPDAMNTQCDDICMTDERGLPGQHRGRLHPG